MKKKPKITLPKKYKVPECEIRIETDDEREVYGKMKTAKPIKDD